MKKLFTILFLLSLVVLTAASVSAQPNLYIEEIVAPDSAEIETISTANIIISNNGTSNFPQTETLTQNTIIRINFGDNSTPQNESITSINANENITFQFNHTYTQGGNYNISAKIDGEFLDEYTTSIEIIEDYSININNQPIENEPTIQITANRDGSITNGETFEIEYSGNVTDVDLELNLENFLESYLTNHTSINTSSLQMQPDTEYNVEFEIDENSDFPYEPGTYYSNITTNYTTLNGSAVENTIPVELTFENHVPEITTDLSNEFVVLGDTYEKTITLNDFEGDDIYFEAPGMSVVQMNSNTFHLSWTPTQTGSFDFLTQISDEFDLYPENINIDVYPNYGVLTTENELLFTDEELSQTLTIENEGGCIISNIEISENNIDNDFDIDIPTTNIPSLPTGQSQNIPITATLPDDLEPGIEDFGKLQIQWNCDGTTHYDYVDLSAQVESKINISNIDVEIIESLDNEFEGDDFNNLEDDNADDVVVHPGDKIKLTFELTNLFTETEDTTFDDIDVEIELDEWNLEFEPNEENNLELEAGENIDSDDLEFYLTIPEDFTNNDDGEVTIKVTAEIEGSSNEHKTEFSFDLELDNVNDQISIIEYKILDENYHEINDNIIDVDAEYFFIDVTVKNTGEDNQDDVIVSADSQNFFSNDFNQEINSSMFDLNSGDEVTKRLKMWTLNDGLCGNRWINLVTYYEEDNPSKNDIFAVKLTGCETTQPDNNNTNSDEEDEEESEDPSNWFGENSANIGDYMEAMITSTDASLFKDRVKIALFVTAGVAILAGITILVVRKINN